MLRQLGCVYISKGIPATLYLIGESALGRLKLRNSDAEMGPWIPWIEGHENAVKLAREGALSSFNGPAPTCGVSKVITKETARR